MKCCSIKKIYGFTLLELLIALFIFTILSMILMTGLRTVIHALSGTESHAAQLRDTQRVLVVLSRDIEQAVNRPVLTTAGNEEPAFLGTPRSFTLTHLGASNSNGLQTMSAMQRVRYFSEKNTLYKATWNVLDQAPETKPQVRDLLNSVDTVRFEYLDESGRFQNNWPQENNNKQALPKAVKVSLNIQNWGSISQLYVITSQPSKTTGIQAPQSE